MINGCPWSKLIYIVLTMNRLDSRTSMISDPSSGNSSSMGSRSKEYRALMAHFIISNSNCYHHHHHHPYRHLVRHQQVLAHLGLLAISSNHLQAPTLVAEPLASRAGSQPRPVCICITCICICVFCNYICMFVFVLLCIYLSWALSQPRPICICLHLHENWAPAVQTP